ncbi:MAG: hypothetical protein U9R36_00635 [Elusimicrobiota bacterium]|nr:hypothetical protein [Elusimicrobiota bacterium]
MENKKETVKEKTARDSRQIELIRKEITDIVRKIQELDIDESAGLKKIERVLKLIPRLRILTLRLQVEKAIIKHIKKLKEAGVHSGLINFIVQKRLDKIKSKTGRIKLNEIDKIESNLGIGDIKDRKEFFGRFRLLLREAAGIDEIEIILRKVRLNLNEGSQLKEKLQKEEIVRKFVNDGNFEEKEAVFKLLMSRNLSSAIRERVVTKKELEEKFNLIEGDIKKFSKDIIHTVEGKLALLSRDLTARPGMVARMISDYLINPLRIVSSSAGIITIIAYTVGRYIMGAGELYATGIETMPFITLCGVISPAAAYSAGVGLLILSGAFKFIDNNLLTA